jgi:lipopolysaccharide export system protein LptA
VSGDDLAAWLRGAALALWLAQPACAATPPAAAERPRVAIGVAAFEAVGAAGVSDPDLGRLLADRIGTLGVQSVVGPTQLGAAVTGEPTPAQVQAWAAASGVSTIAVGRTTRIGERQSIDVRLRAGVSGGLVASYFAEAATPAELGPALDRLAGQVVDGTVAWLTRDVASAPDAAGPPARGAALRSKGDPFGMTSFDNDQPIAIHSDELEASQNAGARHLVFTKNVHVVQGDLQLDAARLEAFYPEKSNQPDRLVATGGVHVVQGTREARCDEAVYHRSEDLLVCEGHAELRDGEDRVAGEVIEFDLAAEKVFVKGGATVQFHPESKKPEQEAPAQTPPASPPIAETPTRVVTP